MIDYDRVETKDDLTNRINEMFKRCEEDGMVFSAHYVHDKSKRQRLR
jgi:hypothetical protein